MRPRISVIVPVYKVEKYLGRCVDSILAQTFTDFECILIDDGSPDNCGAICDAYAEKDSRIKVIHQENAGVSAARNAGLDSAQGEWVAFMDSDDWVESNFLEALFSTASENNVEIGIVGFCGVSKAFKKTKILDQDQSLRFLFDDYRGFGGFSPKKICRLSLINAEPKTRYRTDLAILEDTEFFFRLFHKTEKLAFSNAPVYHYEENPESCTQTVNFSGQKKVLDLKQQLYGEVSSKKVRKQIWNTMCLSKMVFVVPRLLNDKKDRIALEYRRTMRKNFCFYIYNSMYYTSVKWGGVKERIIYTMLAFCPVFLLLKTYGKYYTRKHPDWKAGVV